MLPRSYRRLLDTYIAGAQQGSPEVNYFKDLNGYFPLFLFCVSQRSEIATSFALFNFYPEILSDCSFSVNYLFKSAAHVLLDWFFPLSVCSPWWFIHSECCSFVYYLCKRLLPSSHLLFILTSFIIQYIIYFLKCNPNY